MKRKSPVINFLLILVLFLLLGWGAYSWYNPKFPANVKGDEIVPASRELQVPTLSRKVYSNAMVKDVASLNLFRKQRKKYYRPKPPKPKPKHKPKARIKPAPPKVTAVQPPPPPPRPTAPPPQLVLTGVMILGNQKVAIFEGTYSEIQGKQLVENLKPRRRGYKIGESFGGYKIETIHKTHATLSAIANNDITLTISKTPASNKIEKAGDRLIQKSKTVSNKTAETTFTSPPGKKVRRAPIQKKGLNTETTPSSRAIRASRARRARHLNRTRAKVGSPSTKQPPAISTPGAESPDPSNPRSP